MGLNNKSMRIRTWRDQLNSTGAYKPSFEKSIRLLTYILADVYSPKSVNWVRNELVKIVGQRELNDLELKQYSSLQEKIAKRFILIDERAARRAERKAKKKEVAKSKQEAPGAAPSPAATPAAKGTRWD